MTVEPRPEAVENAHRAILLGKGSTFRWMAQAALRAEPLAALTDEQLHVLVRDCDIDDDVEDIFATELQRRRAA